MKVESIDILSGDFRKAGRQAQQTMNMNINLVGARAEGSLLDIDFEFVATYYPDGSHIRILGKAFLRGTEEEAAGAAAEWASSGKVGGEAGELIINAINYSCSINSVLVSRAINIAPPIVLPTLTLGETASEPAKKAPKPPRKK
ncbi:MAG TPA: hypothetical protein VLD37_05275 [Candidatus Bilamarchaeum sp.]|nr:hypothetical protein [Candidatus Bilamarchaeum sp.]